MLLRHSFQYFLARGVPGVISFIAIALYTRLLSPEQYGQYALVVAGAGLVYTVLFSWLPLGLLRFLPAHQERKKQEALLSTALSIFLGLTIVVISIGCILFFSLSSTKSTRNLFLLGAVLLWARAWFEINLEVARSSLSPKLYGALSFTKVVISVSLGGLLAYLGFGAYGILTGLVLAFLLPTAAIARKQWGQSQPLRVDRNLLWQLALYGVPLTATFALEFVISGSDRIMLAWLYDTESAGLYVVGYDLAKQSLTLLLMVINLAAYPLAIRAFESKGELAAQEQLSENFTLLISVGLPATVGLSLLAPNIAGLLVGEAFNDTAITLMPWIATATLIAGVKAYYVDLSFQLSKRTQLQILIALAGAVSNFVLNLWLIPIYGLMGAAYATVIAYALILVTGWLVGTRQFSLPLPWNDLAKVTVATVVMALILLPIRAFEGSVALLVQIALGGLIYLTCLILLDIRKSRQYAIKQLSLINPKLSHSVYLAFSRTTSFCSRIYAFIERRL